MGKGDGAGSGQPATQSFSAGSSARAGEGLTDGCDDDPATVRLDEATAGRAQDATANTLRRQASEAKVPGARTHTIRRPLSNDYRRLDNLVLLKQEIKKLHCEIKELRDGERRRLDDMRSQAESHKTELAELARHNNRESQKLICEMRTKERIIGRLEKEMGVLRTHCDKLTAKQREEPVPTARKCKKQEMPPHTAKDRAEVSRVDAERTLEQPPAPPEPPDIQTVASVTSDDKAPWRTRPEEKRRKPRHSGRSILEFINSELLDSETAHKTVVFIGDQTDKSLGRIDTPASVNTDEKEVLRIDIPPQIDSCPFRALPVTTSQCVQTCPDRLETNDQSTQTFYGSNSIQVQTEDIVPISRSVQTEETNYISISVQTVDDEFSVVSNDEKFAISCSLSSDSVNVCEQSPTEPDQQVVELPAVTAVPDLSQNKQEATEGCKSLTPAAVTRLPSKLPVLERSKSEDLSANRSTTQFLTKVVSLETLYGVLMEEHVGLVSEAREQAKRANQEKQRQADIESRLSEASQALESLQRANRDLETRLSELTEENDLLEFRLLEMEDAPPKRAVSRGSETARWDLTETQDDISDSGVMSLPTSEDEQYSLCSSEGSSEVIKCRLLSMCRHTDSPTERTCLEDTIALLRHYETRLQALDNLTSARYGECPETKSGRIVATVPPFSSGETPRGPEIRHKDPDPLQESGIFEETHFSCRGTQTDLPESPGDLSQEIQKLVQIRECIEESKTGCSETRELHYLRERLATLEDRIRQYEALPEHSDTRARVELEAILRAQVQRLEERVEQLEEENTKLEEICSELEEQENDTRLRCQKLESKVSSLGEKKIGLKAQLELNSRTIADLKNSLAEEEGKKTEARQAAARMEGLVHQYEKKNFELEERETEVRYRLQVLESTLPAIMMWNMWRMMAVMQTSEREREGELLLKLKSMETELVNENSLLEQSRKAEQELKDKIQRLEELLNSTGHEAKESEEMTERVGRLARDQQEKDKRIQELELREKLYQETLQQADSMFAEMESDYARQISDKESELRDKELKLTESEAKMRRLSKERESTSMLQDRLMSMESDLRTTRDNLSRKEQERAALKYEEERLRCELNTCLDEIQILKTSLSSARGELDGEKKSTRELRELVDRLEYENNSVQQDHESEVSKYKKQIKKLGMELMESEVTISELREEVQTLEFAVKELREELRLERERSESIRVRLESELEESCRKIELLEGNEASARGLSLRDELNMSTWQQCGAETMQETPVPAARTTSARRIQKIIEKIESGAPTPQPRKMGECDIARLAVASLDGKNLNKSLQDLSKAYQHSRICPVCGEVLGEFILELVTMLGVKLPRIKGDQEQVAEYKGEPSDLKSDEVGPGTVSWDAGTGFKPTVSTLELTVDGLEAKCRLKDRLINRLADELRDLAECTGRQDRLVESLNMAGSAVPPDYDRTTLCNHLLGKPPTSLSDQPDIEFAATNPLRLRVLRQVGPDSLLIEWDQPPQGTVFSYEIFINGFLIQRIRSASRTKALLHPVDLKSKIFLTLNTLNYKGELCEAYNIHYP